MTAKKIKKWIATGYREESPDMQDVLRRWAAKHGTTPLNIVRQLEKEFELTRKAWLLFSLSTVLTTTAIAIGAYVDSTIVWIMWPFLGVAAILAVVGACNVEYRNRALSQSTHDLIAAFGFVATSSVFSKKYGFSMDRYNICWLRNVSISELLTQSLKIKFFQDYGAHGVNDMRKEFGVELKRQAFIFKFSPESGDYFQNIDALLATLLKEPQEEPTPVSV